MVIKAIQWEEINKEGPCKTWLGKINGKQLFTIDHFEHKMFNDPYLMTSSIVPMSLKKDDNLEDIQETAQILLEAYINSFKSEE